MHVIKSVKSTYDTINSSNLSGAIDIIVVKQDDGTLRCTPFHVHFGKLSVMLAGQKTVHIEVNDQSISDICMKLGEAGEAAFISNTNDTVADSSSVSTDIGSLSDLSNIDQPPEFINKQLDKQESLTTINNDVLHSNVVKSTVETNGKGHRREHEKRRANRLNLNVSSSEDEQNLENTVSTKRKLHTRKQISMPAVIVSDEHDQPSTVLRGQSFNENSLTFFPLDDDNNQNLPSSKQEPSDNDESISNEESENNELVETLKSDVSSNAIPITPSITIEPMSELLIESNTMMSSLFEPCLSQSAPAESSITITTRSFSNPISESDNRASNFELSDNLLQTPSFEKIRSNAEDEWNKSLQPLINTQSTLTNRITNIWQWKWGELPKQRHAAQLFMRSTNFLSNFWSLRKKTTPTEGIPVVGNRSDELSRSLSPPHTYQVHQLTTNVDQKSGKNNSMQQSLFRDNKLTNSSTAHATSLKNSRKTLVLTSDQLKQLDLKMGVNKVRFSVTTAIQGTTNIEANIFLYDQNTKFVISDIDGTITISDLVGHIYAWIGRDWSHDGIAEFYSAIQENGYQFIYLSARAIGQSQMTRNFLRSIQQGKHPLPLGPLFVSPNSLMTALYREVIAKKPEEFKIECLNNIASLFPNKNPFYAGFGNRLNDQYAYTTVGIPATHIFTINSQSIIIREKLSKVMSSTYKNLHDVVDLIFPPVNTFSSSENYSTFTYWRDNSVMDAFDDEIQAQINEINERERQAKAIIKKKQKSK